jgi:uncharacterized phage-associated protein
MAVQFEFDYEKAVAASVYIASQNLSALTMGKLFKLLYFSDKDHLVRHGRPMTGDYYAAMKDGPVPSHLYNLFKELRGTPSTPPRHPTRKEHKCRRLGISISSPTSDWDN